MQSKITGGPTTPIFTAKVLNKYNVKYYRCNETGFIQTEEPYWLSEAYSPALNKLDVSMPSRNISLSEQVSKILVSHFNYRDIFLDYAGGYGLFTRLMRDKGFDFYHTDKYYQNMFAEHFDHIDLPPNTRVELVTAFHVLWHLHDPITEIIKMLEFSNNLLFTTNLLPDEVEKADDWDHFAFETGRRVAFYTTKALQTIADQLGYHFHTNGAELHLFTKNNFNQNPLETKRDSFLLRKAKEFIAKTEKNLGMPDGLLLRDYQYIKEKLTGEDEDV